MAALSRNQTKALSALLSSSTVCEAAEKAGLSARTIYNYLGDPAFKETLSRRKDKTIDAVIAMLCGLVGESAKHVKAILADDESTSATKLRAVQVVHDLLRQLTELAELRARIATVEEQLKQLGQKGVDNHGKD